MSAKSRSSSRKTSLRATVAAEYVASATPRSEARNPGETGGRGDEPGRREVGEALSEDRADREEDVRRRKEGAEGERHAERHERLPPNAREPDRHEKDDAREARGGARVGQGPNQVERVRRVVRREPERNEGLRDVPEEEPEAVRGAE
jgi:hypothetical protein